MLGRTCNNGCKQGGHIALHKLKGKLQKVYFKDRETIKECTIYSKNFSDSIIRTMTTKVIGNLRKPVRKKYHCHKQSNIRNHIV